MLKALLLALFLTTLSIPSLAAEPVRIATLEAPPMVISSNGQISGMAAELAQEALKRAGYEPKIELMPWKRAVFMTQEGQTDALFYAVYNKERAKLFHYPEEPLFTIDIVTLKRVDSAIVINPDFANLSRWKLGIGRGFSYGPKVKYFIDMANFFKVETTSSNDINVGKLLGHRIDILLVDRTLGKAFMDQHPGKLEYVTDSTGNLAVLDSRPAYLVFSRKTHSAEDAHRITKAIRSMKEDGSYAEILSRYQ